MLLRAYSILLRRKLLLASYGALVAPAVMVYLVTNRWDGTGARAISILQPLLESLGIVSLFLGVIFGVGTAIQLPGVPNEARFLFMRPIPRVAMLLYPLSIAAVTILALPALGWFVALTVLWVTHVPIFGRFAALVAIYPQIRSLGPHPSILAVFAALHGGRRYLAAVSAGLAIFTLFTLLRWCACSTNERIRQIGIIGSVSLPVLLFIVFRSRAILLAQFPPSSSHYLPSNLGIALHFVFAAACICAQFAVMRDREL
jgi:hypothetical protein